MADHIDGMAKIDPSTAACPICGKPAIRQNRPFCSKRCADIDLNRWLSGVYVAPGGDGEVDATDDRVPESDDDA